jgi:hypothetical protein
VKYLINKERKMNKKYYKMLEKDIRMIKPRNRR